MSRKQAFTGSEVRFWRIAPPGIIHGLVVALLGAITHQTKPLGERPTRGLPRSGRFRSIPSASFANAVVVLYAVCSLLGGIVYLYFRVDVRPEL